MAYIEFEVPGTPRGWMRAHPIIVRGRAVMHDPRENKEHAVKIRAACQHAMDAAPWFGCPLTGAMKLEIVAVFEPAASWSKKKRAAALAQEIHHTQKPDATNIGKLVEDALQPSGQRGEALEWPPHGQGYAYADDAAIFDSRCLKRWGYPERTIVRLTPVEMKGK